jgi:uncharacterized protein
MIQQTINTKDFVQTLAHLKAGEKLSQDINEYTKIQLFDTLVKEKQFEILYHFIKDKTIETDIYEYNSFDKTIFESISRYLPSDEESISFFIDFISKFDSINDALESKTLISYFIEKEVPLSNIKALVNAGCDVNWLNNSEENYLFKAVGQYTRNPELMIAYLNYFLEQGLDINALNIVQKTPLIKAIEENKKEYIDQLLQNGATPNHVDKKGNTAFYYAVADKLDIEIYKKLREYDTPQFDVLNHDQVTFLFEYTRMMSDNASETEMELLKLLINDGADLYHPSLYYGKEKTPIDEIVEKNAEVLQTVFEVANLEVNQQDNNGNTLLHKVCSFDSNYDENKAKETYRKVKFLIENGADVSLTNDKDQTALILASEDNLKTKTIELLLKNK